MYHTEFEKTENPVKELIGIDFVRPRKILLVSRILFVERMVGFCDFMFNIVHETELLFRIFTLYHIFIL